MRRIRDLCSRERGTACRVALSVIVLSAIGLSTIVLATYMPPAAVHADETCMSPYMPKITGQEDFVYVWTLGVDGLGDGSDKLVTIDVRPGSSTYGQVVHTVSVGGRHEAHHGGFSDDRRHFWVSGLDTSKVFIFDVRSDPAKPKLVKNPIGNIKQIAKIALSAKVAVQANGNITSVANMPTLSAAS